VQKSLPTRKKKQQMIKEMIEQDQRLSTKLPSGVILYEAKKIVDFLETGIMILPGSARSDWSNSSDEQFEYMQKMHKRLASFSNLYNRSELELPVNK
jgi:hypothetical protein